MLAHSTYMQAVTLADSPVRKLGSGAEGVVHLFNSKPQLSLIHI